MTPDLVRRLVVVFFLLHGVELIPWPRRLRLRPSSKEAAMEEKERAKKLAHRRNIHRKSVQDCRPPPTDTEYRQWKVSGFIFLIKASRSSDFLSIGYGTPQRGQGFNTANECFFPVIWHLHTKLGLDHQNVDSLLVFEFEGRKHLFVHLTQIWCCPTQVHHVSEAEVRLGALERRMGRLAGLPSKPEKLHLHYATLTLSRPTLSESLHQNLYCPDFSGTLLALFP